MRKLRTIFILEAWSDDWIDGHSRSEFLTVAGANSTLLTWKKQFKLTKWRIYKGTLIARSRA